MTFVRRLEHFDVSCVAKVRMRPDDGDGRVIIVASNVPLEKNFTYVINLNKAGLLSAGK